MAINLVIAVTDGDWFNMLRQQPNLAEVNFWAPSTKKFNALRPGELFLFKLRAPHNVIAGGGIFAHANALPCSLAWEAFRDANGARSLPELRARIARYKGVVDPADRSDFEIGCRILTQPFFWEEADWVPVPASWSKNTVAFKTYSTADADGLELWNTVNERLKRTSLSGAAEGPARFGEPMLIRPRLGQGAFRVLVTDTYQKRCAITQESALPALEAAHIRPYGDGGEHEARNGLLLRRDIHSLFDAGYVTVTPDLCFKVSPCIKEEFDSGRYYDELHGKPVFAPDDIARRADVEALRWHNKHVFRGNLSTTEAH